jgi:hypothetical protein
MQMRNLVLQCLGAVSAIVIATHVAAADYAWIQFGPRGLEARAIVQEGAACPSASIDGTTAMMTVRAEPGEGYPVRVCSLPVPAGRSTVTLAGKPLRLPPHDPKRILLLGDSGCRLKGSLIQACNDLQAWPFRLVADVAAYMKPDLVIHVGDYHYRETACPPGNSGCAGSPYGDNWAVWEADFFSPAARLLETAPWVFVRGNHEECSRGGQGWSRALDPRPFDGAIGCQGVADPYFVDFDELRLAILDVSTADEDKLNGAQAAAFKKRFDALAGSPGATWMLLHRPIWGVVGLKNGEAFGANLTLAAATGGHLPANISLMLSGHIHSFEAINYGGGLPPQLVTGEGGDWLDEAMPTDLGGLSLDGTKISSGTSVRGTFGFVLLEKSASQWIATVYDALGGARKKCTLADRAIACE